MELSDIKRLPDYPPSSDVEKYCLLMLEASKFETHALTMEKLRELADRQWHTYERPSEELQHAIGDWLNQSWDSNSNDWLEAVMVVCYTFGLEKEIFSRALSNDGGVYKKDFEKDLANSAGDHLDPWWSLKPAG